VRAALSRDLRLDFMSSSYAQTILTVNGQAFGGKMSKGLQWILGVSAVLIVLAVIASIVLPFFFPRTGWGGWPGMMGPNHMSGGGPMMGGLGMMGLFGLGMLGVPLLFVGLLVLGVIWWVKSAAAPAAPPPPAASAFCANCGKPLQAGWKARPYCGEKV
jgi:hypothetical protein